MQGPGFIPRNEKKITLQNLRLKNARVVSEFIFTHGHGTVPTIVAMLIVLSPASVCAFIKGLLTVFAWTVSRFSILFHIYLFLNAYLFLPRFLYIFYFIFN